MELIKLNRDPNLNDFSSDDIVLNTVSGDLFAKNENQLFKIVSRNQFDQTTTDAILKLLDEATETNQGANFNGFSLTDGFFSIATLSPRTGSNVSLHGGIFVDYGQPLPNSPYIKSNGGFAILMDNDGGENNSKFQIFRDTGVPGIGGTELLELDNDGNLTVFGSISGSSVLSTGVDGGSF